MREEIEHQDIVVAEDDSTDRLLLQRAFASSGVYWLRCAKLPS